MMAKTATRWHILRVGSGGLALCGKRWTSLRVDSPIQDCGTCFKIFDLIKRRTDVVQYEAQESMSQMRERSF